MGDDLLCAEGGDQVVLGRCGGPGDAGPGQCGQLHREHPDAAAGSDYEHACSRAPVQVCPAVQRL
ncbi:hypothetical protein A6A25_39540 [Saccharothrix sp. CB00851]|nr:hypothetical protein [Saccharothrix sp. CB00851]OKI18650.1 hypothetical protein A6A25_39540 [Saccharothrix sp. CB00851]